MDLQAGSYEDFLSNKRIEARPLGLATVPDLHPSLAPHQRAGCEFAIRQGRAALFHDTGLGKTRQQIEWARIMGSEAGAPSLILAPLAVAHQTVREGAAIGVEITRCYDQSGVKDGINIANYDRLDKFDASVFGAVCLDESGILKSFTGSTKRALCQRFAETPYRLCCTATPAPNDHMEIGNHSEFLGIMPGPEMLSRWFIVDTMDLGKYRLKGHAIESFWDWVASWAQCLSSPADLGFDDTAYRLPKLRQIKHIIDTDISAGTDGTLFRMPAMSATDLHREKRLTSNDRAEKVGALIEAEPDEPWLVWCDTDYEADALKARLPDAVEVRGSDHASYKEHAACWFCGDEDEAPCRGKKNTRKTDGTRQRKTQSIASEDASKAHANQKSIENTCNDTTLKTKKIGIKEHKNNAMKSIERDEKSTQEIQKHENTIEISQDLDVRKSVETNGSEQILESRQTNTIICSLSKAEDAPSAGDPTVAPTDEPVPSGTCPSTIAMKQDESEVFSAPNATEASVCSTTSQNCLRPPQTISGKASRVLISKPRIFGFGLNFQHCARVAFVGISYSYEAYYQAIRRCWRFGQKRPVDVHIIMAATESAISQAVDRKADDHQEMKVQMLAATRRAAGKHHAVKTAYNPTCKGRLPIWLK